MTTDTLHQEIEQLHRQTMDRLNALAWGVADELTHLEAIGAVLDQLAQQHAEDDRRHNRRVAMARAVLAGAADATSRRLAMQLIAPWFTSDVQEGIAEIAQEPVTA